MTDAFRLLLPLASQWKIIGLLLNIPYGALETITTNEGDANHRLAAMLQHWSKQVDPSPTRTSLADAVKMIDPKAAESLLETK
jgi:hypothetical protein